MEEKRILAREEHLERIMPLFPISGMYCSCNGIHPLRIEYDDSDIIHDRLNRNLLSKEFNKLRKLIEVIITIMYCGNCGNRFYLTKDKAYVLKGKGTRNESTLVEVRRDI